MLVTLGHAANFIIPYDNKLKDGKRRAAALKSTCEADFPNWQLVHRDRR